MRYLRKNLLRGNGPNLLLAGAGLEREPLLDDLVDAVFRRAFLDPLTDLPRGEADFKSALQSGRGELVDLGNDYERVLLNAFESLVSVRQRLAGLAEQRWEYARRDVSRQLELLLGQGFLYLTPWEWLFHYPRYMKALATRLERITAQPGKDQGHTDTMAALAEPLELYLAGNPGGLELNPALVRYRWLLEELRVSFYAQSLGTSAPVSAKRLQEQWQAVEDWHRQNPR